MIWDPRREAVIFLQERLNVFFGTWALKVDGNFGMQVLTTAPFPPFPTGTRALMVDGNFGPLTQQAVELFQIKCGLRADGTVGLMMTSDCIPHQVWPPRRWNRWAYHVDRAASGTFALARASFSALHGAWR